MPYTVFMILLFLVEEPPSDCKSLFFVELTAESFLNVRCLVTICFGDLFVPFF